MSFSTRNAASGKLAPGGGVSIDEAIAKERRRLERHRKHKLTCEEWGEWLAFHFPREYYDVLEPPEPTKCLPGSGAKINRMTERVANGLSPFHPKDKLFAKKKRRIAKHLANGEDDLNTYETEGPTNGCTDGTGKTLAIGVGQNQSGLAMPSPR